MRSAAERTNRRPQPVAFARAARHVAAAWNAGVGSSWRGSCRASGDIETFREDGEAFSVTAAAPRASPTWIQADDGAASPREASDGDASNGGDAPSSSPSASSSASIQLPGFRRRQVVQFTCNKCGARTSRVVNPEALARGTVFVQCGGCEVWHKLADNLELWGDETDFRAERLAASVAAASVVAAVAVADPAGEA